MLVLNAGAIRFIRDGGFIQSGGAPYEVTGLPYAASELARVRWAQEGNTAWLTHGSYQPRKLVRGSSHTDWTLSLYEQEGGPVKVQNLDKSKTIIASATTGTVTLTASTAIFQAGHVGSVWRLDEGDLSLTPEWKANEAITLPTEPVPATGTTIGSMTNPGNAFDGNATTFASETQTGGFIGTQQVPPSTISSASFKVALSSDPQVNVMFEIYGKAGGAPANATDGTLLGGGQHLLGAAPGGAPTFNITPANITTAWDYQWLRWFLPGGGVVTMFVYELTRERFTAIGAGEPVLRRYNGNVYQAISGSNSGLTPPTHTDGD